MTVSKALAVDRTKVVIGLSKAQYSHCRNQLNGIVDIQNDLKLGDATLKYSQVQYIQGVSLRSTTETNQTLVRRSVGSTETKVLYLAYEIYPHAIAKNQNSFTAFNQYINLLFGPEFSYSFVSQIGRISYLEVCKDYLSVKTSDILPHSAYSKFSDVYPGTQNHKLGSTHAIYDKKLQLHDVKSVESPWTQICRIEAKVRHTGLKVTELHTLPNPLKNLELASMALLKASNDPNFQQFLDRAQKVGVTTAMTTHTKYQRKKLRHYLRECAVPWFNPEQIWTEWPRTVQALQSIAHQTAI